MHCQSKIFSKHKKIFLLVLLTIAIFCISFFSPSNSIYTIFHNLIFIPIILSCFWYGKRGVVFSGIISGLHIYLYSLYSPENITEEIARLIVYILIATLIQNLADKIKKQKIEVDKLNKKAQNDLELLRKAEELSNMGAWRLDLRTQKSVWSNGLYQIFGILPGSIEPSLEKRVEITHPDDQKVVRDTIANSIMNKTNARIESRIIQPNGNVRWISSIGYTEYDEFGEPETYIGAFIDITERKLYEQELYAEREKFQRTVASIGDGVIAADAHGNVTILNRVAEELTGWHQVDAIGKPFEEVFHIVNEATRIKCENPVDKVLQNGTVIELANHTVLISKHGTERSVADSAAPIKDSRGNILGVVLVFRDVTEEKKRRDEIKYISYHDSLTGLYNRRYFEDELQKVDVEENLPISIIMGDVNGLKITNDAFGHMQGDQLLQKSAEAMRLACRTNDIVARLGGDEFVILLPKTEIFQAKAITERIKKIGSEMMVGQLNVSISLGCGIKGKTHDSILRALKNAENLMYENKAAEKEQLSEKFIANIFNSLNAKYTESLEHARRVSSSSQKIGMAMNLSEPDIQKLGAIGLYHDIGKIAIKESVLNKREELTQQEWDEIRRHSDIGYHILKSSHETAEIANYVLANHERFDGKGYPVGLKGEEIPLLSRIVSVADSYDAMISERVYKKAMDGKAAIEELVRNKATQFDPLVVDAFLQTVDI